MIEKKDTRHIVERGTWSIPLNLPQLLDPITFRRNDAEFEPSPETIEVKYCFRDTLPFADPVPRQSSDWPTEELTNFFQAVAIIMFTQGLKTFSMHFSECQSKAEPSHNWNESTRLSEHDQELEVDDPEMLREYRFELARTSLPNSATERTVLSIRRANLPNRLQDPFDMDNDLSGDW